MRAGGASRARARLAVAKACPALVFPRGTQESPAQFKERVKKVEQYMNSNAFKAPRSGTGLMGLAKELHERCRLMVASGGERVPK